MKITLGDFELVSTQARNNDGFPVGPQNLRLADTPGVVKREYIGETRIKPEDVRVHSGSCTFDVHREFGDANGKSGVERALAYVAGIVNEPTEGALKFDSTTVFANAAVTSRVVANVGCSVAVSYTIEG